MPEFFPEHVPSDVDEFTAGYLACMEWLLPEECDENGNVTGGPPHDKMTGFHRDTLRKAKRECAAFQKDNHGLLDQYMESTGCDMGSAGHDFFLTRNGHGAGFWARGDHPCLKVLSERARWYGGTNEELTKRGKLLSY